MAKDKPNSYPLRMSEDLRVLLEAKARENSRSLNTEIVKRLEESLSTPRSGTTRSVDVEVIYALLVHIAETVGVNLNEVLEETLPRHTFGMNKSMSIIERLETIRQKSGHRETNDK